MASAPAPGTAASPTRLWSVAVVYAAWLVAIELVFYLVAGKDENALQYVVMLGAVPVALQIMLLGITPYGLVSPTRLALVILLTILFSYLPNPPGWTAFVYVIDTGYVFALAIIVAGCPDHRLLRSIAAAFSLMSALFLIYINLTGEYIWGRLSAAGLEANFWGLMGLATAVTGFGAGSRLIGGFGFAVGAYTIYAASSRSSILGILAAAGVLAVSHLATLRDRRLFGGLAVFAGALAVAIFFVPAISSWLPGFVDDLMKLDDPYRGLGQGFTGRSTVWSAALDVWMSSPLFGVGFRQHEALLPGALSAHNAYLAMLADTGIVGFLLYCGMLVAALVASFRIADRRTRDLNLAVILSYAVIGLFERRAINTGNPWSVFFLICCFYALAQKQLHAVPQLFSRAPPAGASAQPSP
jgi:O-antigen ligase